MAHPTIAVTGGAGFLGRHFIEALASRPDVSVRALVHRRPLASGPNVTSVPGDLLDRARLLRLLVPDCIVVNLAWDASAQPDEARRQMAVLAAACAEARASRLVHCSTALVVGRTAAARVDETTPCSPGSVYEQAKLAAETALAEAVPRVPLVIARPTAVFGAHGRNLVSLASSLLRGPRPINFLRSCLFDRRRMHLTSVENVVAALLFLAFRLMAGDIERYLLSEDDEPANNFRDVETRLMAALGIDDYGAPRIALPPAALALLLHLRGRSDVSPKRVYDGSRLLAAGFVRPRAFAPALLNFGRWYRQANADPAGGRPQ